MGYDDRHPRLKPVSTAEAIKLGSKFGLEVKRGMGRVHCRCLRCDGTWAPTVRKNGKLGKFWVDCPYYGCNKPQAIAVEIASEKGRVTVKQLADDAGVSRQSAYQTLEVLLGLGILRKEKFSTRKMEYVITGG